MKISSIPLDMEFIRHLGGLLQISISLQAAPVGNRPLAIAEATGWVWAKSSEEKKTPLTKHN